MNTRTLAEKLLTRHGSAALPMIHARETFYLYSIRKAEASKRYRGIARLMARRMVWGAVAAHLRDLTTPRAISC